MQKTKNLVIPISLSVAAAIIGGCALAPKASEQEKAQVAEQGRVYSRPFEQRELPELQAHPTWRDLLQRAFLANGELEAAYFEWKAAVERIDQEAGYPNTNIAPTFSYMFSKENMKAWDRTTINVGFDPMANLELPVKTARRGRIATAEAQAAGARFRTRKFLIQRLVLTAYLDYALMAERVRVQRGQVDLLGLIRDAARVRVEAGAPQQDMLKADVEEQMASDELKNMEAELPQMRAILNAMLGRPTQAALLPPVALPEPRKLVAGDEALMTVAVDANPELAGLAREVQGRRDAIELARMQWLPDINPMAGITGGSEQMIGAMVVLPTRIPQIKAAVREARAMLAASEAMARQTRLERGASFGAALYALRNSERQADLLERRILPAAEQTVANAQQAYSAGAVEFLELIDSQRTRLDVQLALAEAKVAREKRLADMEALAGVDVETLASSLPSAPATRPATQPAAFVHEGHTNE